MGNSGPTTCDSPHGGWGDGLFCGADRYIPARSSFRKTFRPQSLIALASEVRLDAQLAANPLLMDPPLAGGGAGVGHFDWGQVAWGFREAKDRAEGREA